jgi:hypothetical protein
MVGMPHAKIILYKTLEQTGNNIKMGRLNICDMAWIGFSVQVPGCCEQDNEHSGSVNGGEILEQLDDC